MANAIKITTDGTTTTETVNGLQDFQKHVEGWVELLYTDDERHIFWFNEEGKVNGMAANDKAHRLVHELVTGLSPWDVIVGPVLITGPLAADGEHDEAPGRESRDQRVEQGGVAARVDDEHARVLRRRHPRTLSSRARRHRNPLGTRALALP